MELFFSANPMEPPNLSIVTGDLLDAPEQYLCHQCNCVTRRGKHLSHAVFQRFPHADIYRRRAQGQRDQPGTIVVAGDGAAGGRRVINLLAQLYPGKFFQVRSFVWIRAAYFYLNQAPHASPMTRRAGWFASCSQRVRELPDLQSVAFPYGIGCGAAGGDWPLYLKMLTDFARLVPETRVVVYRLPAVNH